MQIEQLPGLEAEHVMRLRASGIYNSRQLLRVCRRQRRLSLLSRDSQLPPEMLRDVIHNIELGQIRGIGPTTLEQLWAVGISSVAVLANQEPMDLQVQLQKVAGRSPNLAVIENWILQAQHQEK